MTILSTISREEHQALSEFIKMKSKALFDHENANGHPRNVFIGQMAWGDCFKVVICDGNDLYFAFSRLIRTIIEVTLLDAMNHFPESFGRRDASAIIQALKETYPYYQSYERFESFLARENCIYVAKNTNGVFADELLRLDLFRLIKKNPKDGSVDFIGGLFHAMKHFDLDKRLFWSPNHQCSTDMYELIILLSTGFFLDREIREKDERISYHSSLEVKDGRCLVANYYKEQDSEVFFLNTCWSHRT